MFIFAFEMEERYGLLLASFEVSIHAWANNRTISSGLLGLSILLGHNLMLVHSQGMDDFLVQRVELELRRFRKLVLLANKFVHGAQVVLDFGPIAVLGNLATFSHLPNIVLKLASTRTWHLFVVEVAASVDGRLGSSGNCNILVDRSFVEDVSAVLDELLPKFFGKLVCLATIGRAMIHMVLHKVEKSRV